MIEELLNFKSHYKNIKRNIALNNYYTTRTKKGKSIYATILDWFFTVLIVLFLSFIAIFTLIDRFILTIIVSIFLTSIYVSLSIKWNRKLNNKKINKINEEIANKQVLKNLAKYSNRDFTLFVKGLLEKYYDTTFFEYNKHIDFMGEINGEIYGVKCLKNSLENQVFPRDLDYFIREMEKKDIEEGIIVTSSTFADEIKDRWDYILIDFEYIKKILKEIGSFPSDEEVEELIIAKYNTRNEYLKKGITTVNKHKIFRFIILGVILTIFSNFVIYERYYKIIGILSILIGLGNGIYNIIKYFK